MALADRCIGALTALAVLTVACAPAKSDPDSTNVPTQQDPIAAAVRVEAFGCNASAAVGAGSFIASERVITVAHVVAGSTRIEVVLADGTRASAKVTAIDRRVDLAILDVEVEVAPLARGKMPHDARGTFVVYRGEVASALPFHVLTEGAIDVPDLDQQGSSHRHGFELAADVQDGDSGSVLVSHGAATGVVFARSALASGRAWAVDIAEATHLLAADKDVAVATGECVTQI